MQFNDFNILKATDFVFGFIYFLLECSCFIVMQAITSKYYVAELIDCWRDSREYLCYISKYFSIQ